MPQQVKEETAGDYTTEQLANLDQMLNGLLSSDTPHINAPSDQPTHDYSQGNRTSVLNNGHRLPNTQPQLLPNVARPATSSARRRPHNGKACLNCRRRKARCEGEPPACRTCVLYRDECAWDEFGDGRRPASRTFVHALKTRIRHLEAEVSSLRAQAGLPPVAERRETDDTTSGGDDTDIEPIHVKRKGDDEKAEEVTEQVVNTMMHLRVSDGGEEVLLHGPTSAYAHTSPSLLPSSTENTPPSDTNSNVNTPTGPTDFRRYLPPAPRLSSAQHTLILARFFKYYASWALRVHPIRFFADMAAHLEQPLGTPLPRYAQYSPFLHNIALAIALTFADEPELRTPEVKAVFADRADEHLKAELKRPVPATVQGLAVKSSYLSTAGNHTAGWAYFGMGERIAHTLGLNVDCTPCLTGVMSQDEVNRRTETFWTVFIQEQTWAVYTGRPHPVSEYSTHLPHIDPELDAQPFVLDSQGQSKLSEDTESASSGAGQPCLVGTTFCEFAKLAVIMQRVLTTLYGIRSHADKEMRESIVSDLALELDTWAESLPPNLSINGHTNRNSLPHVIMLQLAREWITIFIHRPCYRMSSSSDDKSGSETASEAVRRCDRSASRIISLLRIYQQRFSLRLCPPTMFNITFTAGTTCLLSALHHPTATVKTASIGEAGKCVAYLRIIGRSWKAAEQKADILEDLLKRRGLPESGGLPGGLKGVFEVDLGMRRISSAAKIEDAEGSVTPQNKALMRGGSVREGKFKFPLPVRGKKGKGGTEMESESESESENETLVESEPRLKKSRPLVRRGGPTAESDLKGNKKRRQSTNDPSTAVSGSRRISSYPDPATVTSSNVLTAIRAGIDQSHGFATPTRSSGSYSLPTQNYMFGSEGQEFEALLRQQTGTRQRSNLQFWDTSVSSNTPNRSLQPAYQPYIPSYADINRIPVTEDIATPGPFAFSAESTSGVATPWLHPDAVQVDSTSPTQVDTPMTCNYAAPPPPPVSSSSTSNYIITPGPSRPSQPLNAYRRDTPQLTSPIDIRPTSAYTSSQPQFSLTPINDINMVANITPSATPIISASGSLWGSPPSEFMQFLPYLSSPHAGDPVGDSVWQNYQLSDMSTGSSMTGFTSASNPLMSGTTTPRHIHHGSAQQHYSQETADVVTGDPGQVPAPAPRSRSMSYAQSHTPGWSSESVSPMLLQTDHFEEHQEQQQQLHQQQQSHQSPPPQQQQHQQQQPQSKQQSEAPSRAQIQLSDGHAGSKTATSNQIVTTSPAVIVSNPWPTSTPAAYTTPGTRRHSDAQSIGVAAGARPGVGGAWGHLSKEMGFPPREGT